MIFRIRFKTTKSFSSLCFSFYQSLKNPNVRIVLSKSLFIKRINTVMNINNSVILIFVFISWCIIEFLINPYFSNYNWYDLRYLLVVVFIYFGILIFVLLFFSQSFRNKKFIFFFYSIVYLISFSGYFVSGRTWLKSEIEVAKKVYGLYKSNHATKDLKEIEFAAEKLCLDVTGSLNNKK